MRVSCRGSRRSSPTFRSIDRERSFTASRTAKTTFDRRSSWTSPTEFDRKLEAIRCYGSQFDTVTQAGEVYPNGDPLYDIVRHQAAHYGSLIRTRYGEPFFTTETMRVDDITTLEVATF